MKRILLWSLLVLILLLGGYFAFIRFVKKDLNLNALTVIPADAIYIIQTNQPLKSWKQISKSDVWQHLKKLKVFDEIGKSADALDSLINNNSQLFDYLGDREVYISAHKTRFNDYDFLYILDLGGEAKVDFLQSLLKQAFDMGGYRTSIREVQGHQVVKCFDRQTGEALQFTIIDNQLVCSYNAGILDKAIETSENPHFTLNEKFKEIADRTPNGGLFKLYINGAYFDDFMQCYQQPLDEMTIDISRLMKYSGLSADIDNDHLSLDGFMNIDDSMPSYLRAMLQNGNGSIGAQEIISEKAAMYLSLGFEKFSDFYIEFEQLLQRDSAKWESYKKNYRQAEKLLNINIKENFISWIGKEVGYVIMPPTDSIKVKDFALVIKANDIDKAKEQLKYIAKKIKRRTILVKVKTEEYNGYEINTIAMRGFFKLLFGKLFDKFEKPFYTFVDDYVVFSNNAATLKTMIDDYKAEKTLSRYDGFTKIYSNFNKSSNVFVYVNMPSYLPLSRESVAPATYASMMNNQIYITCFRHSGFQLSGYKQYFSLKINSEFYHKEKDIVDSIGATVDSLPILDSTAAATANIPVWEIKYEDEPVIEGSKLKQFKEHGTLLVYEVEVNDEHKKSGYYTEYDENKKVKVKGKFKNDAPYGKWIWFNESGNIIERKEY